MNYKYIITPIVLLAVMLYGFYLGRRFERKKSIVKYPEASKVYYLSEESDPITMEMLKTICKKQKFSI